MINSRGGIIGCGHPVGATGVAQVAEIASQLAGEAGKRQVKDCKTGLVATLTCSGLICLSNCYGSIMIARVC